MNVYSSYFLPAGIGTIAHRNNNPLNIRRVTSNNWVGRDTSYQGAFERFLTTTFGVRAGIVLLRTYHRNGFRTISQIINRFAPPVGMRPDGTMYPNNTQNYINFVVSRSGFGVNQVLEFNARTYFPVISAMCRFESQFVLSESDFATAWALT